MSANAFDRELMTALDAHRAGRFSDAERAYRRLLETHPNHPTLLNLYGVLAIATGRAVTAEPMLRRATELNPLEANYHSNLGEALRHLGRYDSAVEAYRRAIQLNPNLATAHNNLGIALAALDRLPEAIESYATAIQLDAGDARSWSNLGNALRKSGEIPAAIAACSRATTLQPGDVEFQTNLGAALAADQRFDEAVEAYESALKLRPDDLETLSNLCNTFSAIGRDVDAIKAGTRAVALSPDSVQAHWNLAVALLRAGEWDSGWTEYEWRWKRTAMPIQGPRWSRLSHDIQTVLFHAEQGFGDAIQFARFVPVAAEHIHASGGRVVVRAAPSLVRLFRFLKGVDLVISTADPLPAFDAHLPFMSLPQELGVRPDHLPGIVPYFDIKGRTRRGIGICLTGSPAHNNDRFRSIPRTLAQPLFDAIPNGVSLHPTDNPALTDFAATAEVIAGLERVICVDTAVAHLAGAIGTPVWILLPHVADWRWLRDAETTPWYPTARLFRQKSGEDWAAVIRRVIAALNAPTAPDLVPSPGTPGERLS